MTRLAANVERVRETRDHPLVALYELRDGALRKRTPVEFSAMGIRERQDLQALLFS